ncbi:MAG: hypothetical protein IV100_26320 [Myxococcales bacterium]|nr:hypothetical protein [Myxococcales bacterium]
MPRANLTRSALWAVPPLLTLVACESFDQGRVERIAELVIDGPGIEAAAGRPLKSDAVDPVSWEVPLPGVPAAIFATEVRLSITDTERGEGDDDDFGFLTGIRFTIASTRDGSTLPPRLLAWNLAPGSVKDLVLDTAAGLDVTDYIVEGFELRVTVEGVVPEDAVSFDGEVVLAIDVI